MCGIGLTHCMQNCFFTGYCFDNSQIGPVILTKLLLKVTRFYSKLSQAQFEAIVIFAIAFALWLIAAQYDLFEIVSEFMESHEDWELDELIMAVSFAGFGGFVFGARRLLELARELKLRKEAEQQSTWLAQHDPLTHLPNRRYLSEYSKTLQVSKHTAGTICVLAVDLDGFKKINDLLGHDAGDKLLEVTADRLRQSYPNSTVFRLGGDEFLIVALKSETPKTDQCEAAEALVRLLNQPVDLLGVSAEVGASIGIATNSNETGKLEDLLFSADAALYYAKRAGRNNVTCFEPFMREDVSKRAARQASVKTALEENKLVPYFQPILDLETGLVVGVEVLTRWPENTGSPFSTQEIIGFAEELGLILPFSEHLLRLSISNSKQWPQEIGLSFNLGPAMLSDKRLAERIESILHETGFVPARLIIEVSEAALHLHHNTASITLPKLSELGIRIALDGYGAGHSNVRELAKMPFDIIKLDRLLLADAAQEDIGTSVFKSYVNVIKALEKPVVAIGIETDAQKQLAQELGCQFGQGHLFSPAVSEADITAVLKNRLITEGAGHQNTSLNGEPSSKPLH